MTRSMKKLPFLLALLALPACSEPSYTNHRFINGRPLTPAEVEQYKREHAAEMAAEEAAASLPQA